MNKQLKELCREMSVSESDYKNVCGLLKKINEFYIKPLYQMTKIVISELQEDDDIIEVERIAEAGLIIIRTVMSEETLTEVLDDLIDGDFAVFELQELSDDIPDDPFKGVPRWKH